jgi:hypothetical protein
MEVWNYYMARDLLWAALEMVCFSLVSRPVFTFVLFSFSNYSFFLYYLTVYLFSLN